MHKQHARLRRALETFWLLPALAILLAVAAGLLIPFVDTSVALPGWLAISGQEDTARAVLSTIVTVGVSIAGVSFSIIAVALVLSSQQLSPRVLRSFQRQPLNQAVLAVLLGTAIYSLFVLGSVSEDTSQPVPELAITLAMVAAACSLALFVVFLHHAVRSMNASVVIRRIAADGHEALAMPYPAGVGEDAEEHDEVKADRSTDGWEAVEIRAPRAGYVASVDGHAIVAWATEHDAFVAQRRGVGSFAVTNAVLATVHHAGRGSLDTSTVCQAFMLNEERVVDGDITFPIRQLADIALKGLSPGINDPTTSENAMDSVTDTLVRFAQRPAISALRLDDHGSARLRALTPTLDDLVRLGFDQVRRDAATKPSFAIRLLELLADLREAATGAARGCEEIDRQARLICEHAGSLADHEHDQQIVTETYDRLHGQSTA